jgi:hypothetical protein
MSEYLYYILLSERDKIAGKRIHRTQDNLNQTKLENWEIPVIINKKEQMNFLKEVEDFEKNITL